MNTVTVATHEPLVPRRDQLRVYLRERYPTAVAVPLCLSLGLATNAVAQVDALARGARLTVDGRWFSAAALAYLFLLLLRIYDEHKDVEVDAATRPDRPVQRGLISLRQLRTVGAIALAAQLVLAFGAGWRAGLMYLVPLAYSLAMLVEFGAHRWLGERLLVYAASHMIVMPLLALALIAHITPEGTWSAASCALMVGVFAGFFALEVMRKLHAPSTEVAGVDSYSSKLGARGGAALASGLALANGLAASALGWWLGGRIGWLAVLVAVTAGTLAPLWRFAKNPTPDGERMLQPLAGLHLLVALAGIGVVAAVAHGLELKLLGSVVLLGG